MSRSFRQSSWHKTTPGLEDQRIHPAHEKLRDDTCSLHRPALQVHKTKGDHGDLFWRPGFISGRRHADERVTNRLSGRCLVSFSPTGKARDKVTSASRALYMYLDSRFRLQYRLAGPWQAEYPHSGDAAFRMRRAVTKPPFTPRVGGTYRAGPSGRPRYPCVPPAFTFNA